MRAGSELCRCYQLMVCTRAGLHRLPQPCVSAGGRLSLQEHQLQNLIPWILK